MAMWRELGRVVAGFFARRGVAFLSQRYVEELKDQRRALFELAKASLVGQPSAGVHSAECIVFSKDRPLQLHALLSSYFEKVTNPAPVHVLYRASASRYEVAYDNVMALFRSQDVRFRSEGSFRHDLLDMLDGLRSNRVFFLVDDIVFVEDLDLSDLTRVDPERFILSLRLGKNLRRCYTEQRYQPLPEFLDGIVKDEDKLCWRWVDGQLDWGYPFSVDGHLFSTLEIRIMARVSRFCSPNSFEGALHSFSDCARDRLGACYVKSKIVNIPCNKVQTENANIAGSIHQGWLLEQWERGYQLDYRRLYGWQNESAHQERDLALVPRVHAAGDQKEPV